MILGCGGDAEAECEDGLKNHDALASQLRSKIIFEYNYVLVDG